MGDGFYDGIDDLGIDESALPARAGKKGGQMKKAFGTPRAGFNQVFGFDPGLPRDEITGSIPQALMLMNGPQLARAIDGDRPTVLGRLLREEPDDRAVADELHVRGGAVVGKTDAQGVEVTDRPVTVPDLFATFCTSMGIDPTIENMASSGRPIKLVDGGKAVAELFA